MALPILALLALAGCITVNAPEEAIVIELNVNIRQGGELVINGETLTENQLLAKLRAIVDVHQNQPVRLRGDGDISYQTLMEVIDICQQAGIWNISFATRKPK